MKVNPFLAPIIVIVAILGSVLGAQASGIWSTSGRTAVNVQQMTIADVKGWMTLQQVMDGLKISQSDLYQLAHIPADVPTSTALKDLENVVPDFEVTALRDKLATVAPTTTPLESK